MGQRAPRIPADPYVDRSRDKPLETVPHVVQQIQRIKLITRRSRVRIPPRYRTEGRIWVGDQNNARIQRFTETGTYMLQFGTAGSGAGQFSFGWPMGIAADGNGNLWIADTSNNRVQKWG
jgi:hypothetical protein